MIPKGQLRIGNLVALAHESNVPIVTIKELKENAAIVNRNDGGFTGFHYEDLTPIDLSEYWLERLGFEKAGNDGYGGYLSPEYNIGAGNFRIRIRDLKIYETGNGRLPVNYVHSLQNLIFTLTGKELTIKEPINEAKNK